MRFKQRDYQKRAVEAIYKFYNGANKNGKIILAVGTGKSVILSTAFGKIIQSNPSSSILLLSSNRILSERMFQEPSELSFQVELHASFKEDVGTRIKILNYDSMTRNSYIDMYNYNLIIFDEAHLVDTAKYKTSIKAKGHKYLEIHPANNLSEDHGKYDKVIFEYSWLDAINDGYVGTRNESTFKREFFVPLLRNMGYKEEAETDADVQLMDGNRAYFDIIVRKDDTTYIFEIKGYKSLNVRFSIVEKAIQQVNYYKNNYGCCENTKFILVMLTKIDNIIKEFAYRKYGVKIWDISNLIYLCKTDGKLFYALTTNTPYSIEKIEAEEIIEKDEIIRGEISGENDIYIEYFKYKTRLHNCKPGRAIKSDKVYEGICTDIIKYLFWEEFDRVSDQHRTGDNMFQMDLLCSLKGTSEFWRVLLDFYCSKFVVFEYKNYTNKIPQNVIYITEKYLFPVALRNVAIIISRKGFNDNAQSAAVGCLRENNKMILDLTDEDLLKMIIIKEDGEDPSDYLLSKLENLLMSVSK